MAVFLLDSSVIIDLLNNRRDRPRLLRDLVSTGHILACCPVNVSEVYAGLQAGEEQKTHAFLTSLDYYPVTFAIARRAGLLRREYGRKGVTLSLADTTIAAVAMEHGLSLITDNVKDFPMKELMIYTPAAKPD